MVSWNATLLKVRALEVESSKPLLAHCTALLIAASAASLDIKLVYPPKYLAYYSVAYPHYVENAQDYVLGIIEEEGPFDGVMGFSQGAALAASLILEQRKTHPFDETFFKFAIFICATLSFNRDDRSGLQSWEQAKSGDKLFIGEFSGEDDAQTPLGFPPPELKDAILGRYHPGKTPDAAVPIPTVHIIGKSDAYAMQGRLLADMCNKAPKTIIEHQDDHRLPRDPKMNDQIAKSIANMIDRVRFAVGG